MAKTRVNDIGETVIEFSPSQITFTGRLFKDDAAKEVKDILGREVQKLAKQGRTLVRAGIRTRNGTGFSRRHIVVRSTGANSLYATVALAGEDELPPRVYPPRYSNGRPNPRAGQPVKGTDAYPAKRLPFIVLSVLESGRYGGRHVNVIRARKSGRFTNRRKWQKATTRRQPPLFMFRRAEKALKARTPAVRSLVIERISERYSD